MWSVKVNVKAIFRQAQKKSYYRLWFSTSELKKFCRIILIEVPLIWDLFEKKMIIKYPKLQERWISELKSILSTRRMA